MNRKGVLLVGVAGGMLMTAPVHAGPPFMTDDPEPIEVHHYEAYFFGTMDKSNDGRSFQAPAFEINTSPVEDIHLHAMIPMAGVQPNGQQNQYGIGDIELGVKYRFIHETEAVPQVGIFPMIEMPTGNHDKGLGNGRAWYTFPLWIQKSWGPWTTYGGGGRAFNDAPGMRDYTFGGWLLQRKVTEQLILGGELFAQGATATGGRDTTFLNVGGYYNDIPPCGGCSLLFRVGGSVAGENHQEAYLGLYWTWGGAEGEK